MDKGDNIYLQSLELDKAGDWNGAHELIQDVNSQEASWIHAYLHRKEGDESNARYWYNRAGQDYCLEELKIEWHQLWRHFSNLN
jgi:hypothetical protein